MKTVYSCVL